MPLDAVERVVDTSMDAPTWREPVWPNGRTPQGSQDRPRANDIQPNLPHGDTLLGTSLDERARNEEQWNTFLHENGLNTDVDRWISDAAEASLTGKEQDKLARERTMRQRYGGDLSNYPMMTQLEMQTQDIRDHVMNYVASLPEVQRRNMREGLAAHNEALRHYYKGVSTKDRALTPPPSLPSSVTSFRQGIQTEIENYGG